MELGEHLVYGTARAAVTLYFAALLALVLLTGDDRLTRARRLWTIGWLFYLAHVAAAFQFVHRWSHAEAAASTDFQTELETGLPITGGIYFNYAFTVVWTLDVAWWWIAPRSYARRPRAIAGIIHGFLFFMVVNATVVFGRGLTRWLGVIACAVLAVVWYTYSKKSASPNEVPNDRPSSGL